MMSFIKQQFNAHKRMVIMIIPASICNYIVVWLLANIFHIPDFWIIGPVVIGDIVGIEINTQVFRKYGYPKESKP
jgi:hypothetical protein